MDKNKSRIEIKDLDVNLEELKKITPQVLEKIRGGELPSFLALKRFYIYPGQSLWCGLL